MTAPNPYTAQPVEIVVDGQKRMVSQDELVKLAQKGVSADSRFQEAADLSKENAADKALREDLRLLADTGDITAFRRAGAAMGLNGDEVEEAARIVYEQMDGEGTASPGEYDTDGVTRTPQGGEMNTARRFELFETELSKMKSELAARRTGYGDLDRGLQTAILDVEQGRVSKIIQNSLDNDPVMVYYMKSLDGKGQQAVRNMIDEKIRGRLDASNGEFGDGAQILREVIPEVRETLEAIGTPTRSIPQMGLGPAPGGQGADIYPTKQPDHVPSTESNWEEHIAETLRYNEFQANQGQ